MKRTQIFVDNFSDIDLDNIKEKEEYIIDISGKVEENGVYCFLPLKDVFIKKNFLLKSYRENRRTYYYTDNNYIWIITRFFKKIYGYDATPNILDIIDTFKEKNIKVSFDGKQFKLIKPRKLNSESIELKSDKDFSDYKDWMVKSFTETKIIVIKMFLYSRNSIEKGNVSLKVVLFYGDPDDYYYMSSNSAIKRKVFHYIDGQLVPTRNNGKPFNPVNMKEAIDYIEETIRNNLNSTQET